MFSRSDKAEETSNDEMFDAAEPTNRTPLMLAALAGLLAIVGAFLVFQYLGGQSDEAADAEAAAAAVPQTEVLFASQEIPAGTDVSDLLEAPASFLVQRTVPVEFAAPEALEDIEQLRELDGLTLTADLAPGEQLIASKFEDPSSFALDSVIDRNAEVAVPEGHHTVVLPISADRALGANFGGGELISILGTYGVAFLDDEGQTGVTTEIAVVLLPAVEVIAVQTTADAIGALDPDADVLGIATVGDLYVTLALEGDEITQLTHAMTFADDITVAGAIEGAEPDDARALSTIDSIVNGSTLINVGDLSELFANSTLAPLVDPDAEAVFTSATSDDEEGDADGEGEGADGAESGDDGTQAEADEAPAEG